MSKQRIDWIDVAKGIGMILVIFGHFGMNPVGKYEISFIKSSFHMPLFFVLSGFLFKESSSIRDFFKWCLRRFVTLMVPFYIWTAMYSNGSYMSFLGILYGSNQTLGFAGTNAALWFVPCICIAGIILKSELFFVNKICTNKYVKYLLIFVLNFIVGRALPHNLIQEYGWPMSLNIAFTGAGFIGTGMFAKSIRISDGIISNRSTPLALLVSIALTVISAEMNTAAKEIIVFKTAVMAWAEYGFYPLFLLSGVFGSMFIIQLSKMIEKTKWLKILLSIIGRNTLIILAIHFSVMLPFEKMGNHFSVLNNLIFVIISVFMVAIICSWIAEIIKILAPSLSVGNCPSWMKS